MRFMQKNLNLFSEEPQPVSKLSDRAPLAERLRPAAWDEWQGLADLDQGLIRVLRTGSGTPPSLILWGPPGSGKTSLARLIGRTFKGQFIEYSAVLVGVQEIREAAKAATRSALPTILFVDEIHRLNKGQQDAFLPHVEKGVFTLIGATTENPSFYLTNALLSRCRVVVIPALSTDAIEKVAERAVHAIGINLTTSELALFRAAGGGDARQLLNLLESFVAQIQLPVDESARREMILNFLKGAGRAFYDRDGEEHYNVVSAFIKSMRGSDPDAALYWCFRMIEGGEDPRFVIRRMMIFASEDIGNADPSALPLTVATAEAFDRLGLPEGKIPLAHCVTYLASTAKSNRSYVAMHEAIAAVKEYPRAAVPMHLRNAPTKLMESIGYGKDYDYPHNHGEGFAPGVEYLPAELQGRTFYRPSEHGNEAKILERFEKRRGGT